MQNFLKIIIPDNPQAKQRSRKGRSGKWYNPQSDEMEVVKRIIKQQLPENFKMIPKDIPIIGNVYWFIEPSKSKANKKFIDLIQNDDIPHIQKPDRDNLDKYGLDCMSKIVFADDCQVYGGEIYKFWSMKPRTEIEIIWSDK